MPSCARLRRRRWSLATIVAGVIGTAPARADEPTASLPSAEGEPRDSFVADDGRLRSFTAEYRDGRAPGRREADYFRAAAEMVGLLGTGWVLYYFHTADHAHADYPDAGERFQNFHVTFDTNAFNINALGHPAAGAVYHLFSRTNGLSIPVSFAYSAVSSAVWEVAFEVHEKASLNDFVITPVAGTPAGEVLVHLGDYFNSAPRPRWYHELLAFVFGPTHKLHRALDDYEALPSRMPPDRLGFSSFYSHRFDLLFGPVGLNNNLGDHATALRFRANGELVSLPGFLRPGRFDTRFSDGEFVEVLVQADVGENGNNAWDILADANLFGRYAQDISGSTPSGQASMFAFNMAVRYANRWLLGRRDNYFMAHAAGPALKLWSVSGDFAARLEGTAHFDFSLVRPLAFTEYAERFGEDGLASSMREQDYYFGVGWSGLVRGMLSYKYLELGSRLFYGQYDSIDQWDRRYVRDSVHASDRIAEIEGWLGLVPRAFPVQFRSFVEYLPRSSTTGSVTTSRWDLRYGLTFGGKL